MVKTRKRFISVTVVATSIVTTAIKTQNDDVDLVGVSRVVAIP